MSEQPSSGSRPLLPGQIASWLRLVCFAAAALIVTAYAYLAVRQAPNEEADRRKAQKDLRAENAKKAQALLTEPARNADGTYRIPVKDATALIAADNKVIAKIQAAAAPAPAPDHQTLPSPPERAKGEGITQQCPAMWSGAGVRVKWCGKSAPPGW